MGGPISELAEDVGLEKPEDRHYSMLQNANKRMPILRYGNRCKVQNLSRLQL